MADIRISNLKKSFDAATNKGTRQPVLKDISLNIKQGDFVTLFGPNGCGKTTLLKVLSGIESMDSGEVFIGSKSPIEAKTGFVFQNYSDSLMPWLTCRDNILFPYTLKVRKKHYAKAEGDLSQILNDLNISLPLDNYGYSLSGGQKQLTAILRTLIHQPDVILMDEPFSALDYQTRRFMQKVILKIWERDKPTILFVSHDLEEAIYLANKLVLLSSLPATVSEEIEIPFARPRSFALYESEEFFELKRKCLRMFHREVQ